LRVKQRPTFLPLRSRRRIGILPVCPAQLPKVAGSASRYPWRLGNAVTDKCQARARHDERPMALAANLLAGLSAFRSHAYAQAFRAVPTDLPASLVGTSHICVPSKPARCHTPPSEAHCASDEMAVGGWPSAFGAKLPHGFEGPAVAHQRR